MVQVAILCRQAQDSTIELEAAASGRQFGHPAAPDARAGTVWGEESRLPPKRYAPKYGGGGSVWRGDPQKEIDPAQHVLLRAPP